jgi:DNA-binding transcriptional LysR family regulator
MQAAAKALDVNQSTVQRRIAELEERVGRRLVVRHLSGYRLTALGEEMRPAAEGVAAAVAAFERDLVARDKGITGTIRLTCGSSVAACLRRTPLIDAFHARHLDLHIELVITDRVLDLSKGEADLAIRVAMREGGPRDEALVRRKIADVSWSVYASRGYLERYGRPADPDNLKGHLVIGCDGPIADYPGAHWQRSVVHHARIATRCDHWQGLILAVRAGAGLAALPHFQGDNENDLVRVIDDIGLVLPCYLFMHRDMQHTPRVRAFADFVSSEIKSFRALLSSRSLVSP